MEVGVEFKVVLLFMQARGMDQSNLYFFYLFLDLDGAFTYRVTS